jgi:hypothetical protein
MVCRTYRTPNVTRHAVSQMCAGRLAAANGVEMFPFPPKTAAAEGGTMGGQVLLLPL